MACSRYNSVARSRKRLGRTMYMDDYHHCRLQLSDTILGTSHSRSCLQVQLPQRHKKHPRPYPQQQIRFHHGARPLFVASPAYHEAYLLFAPGVLFPHQLRYDSIRYPRYPRAQPRTHPLPSWSILVDDDAPELASSDSPRFAVLINCSVAGWTIGLITGGDVRS